MTDAPSWNWDRLRDVVEPLGDSRGEASQVVIGKYRILRELARGAMGIVYEAEDLELKRSVAIKLLQELTESREDIRARFQREALAAAKLSHPNVIRVYDSGEADGRLFLVMELIRGRPLSDILGERTTEPRAMLGLLEKIARGVSAAHEAGIVHRDIKPANILVTEAGEPKVGDFGLAHWMDSKTLLTKTGAALGTPMYMSPEQVMGSREGISPATDVFALGSILYEILTGRPPHTGENTAEIYSRILNEDPMRPRRLNTRTPSDLETICMKSLEKDPARRYPTAKEFADDLRHHLDGEPIAATPPGLMTISVKWVRRHRLASGMTAVGIAGLLAVAGVILRNDLQHRRAVTALLGEGRDAFNGYKAMLAAGSGTEAGKWSERERARHEAGTKARVATLFPSLQKVLGLDPMNREARAMLAELHYADLEEAERKLDDAAAEILRQRVDFYDDGRYRGRLALEGSIEIDSRPSGAEVELLRYDELPDGRKEAVSLGPLGRTPVPMTRKPAESYLLVLRKEGYRDVRCPVRIGRASSQSLKINLYTDEEIGKDFVYVPGGTCIQGADLEARNGAARRDPHVEDFFIARYEVPAEEYVDFLNSVIAERGAKVAQRMAPRMSISGNYLLEIPDGAAHVVLPPAFPPRWPIQGISWHNADEFCLWKTRKEGGRVTYRMPTSIEWEKAARGVDGRKYPWGDVFDWSFTNGAKSWPEGTNQNVKPGGATPADCSPYGIFDLAGNLDEFCDDWVDERQGIKHKRGAAFGISLSSDFRAANQGGAGTNLVNPFYSFRLVRVPRKDF